MDVDRLLPVCELLLGAAFADTEFHQRERAAIIGMLTKLLDVDELPAAIKAAIEHFDINTFSVKDACAEFKEWPDLTKRELLQLIGAVHDADDVFDFAEDDYMRAVASELGVTHASLHELVLSYQMTELKTKLSHVLTPPPLPRSGK